MGSTPQPSSHNTTAQKAVTDSHQKHGARLPSPNYAQEAPGGQHNVPQVSNWQNAKGAESRVTGRNVVPKLLQLPTGHKLYYSTVEGGQFGLPPMESAVQGSVLHEGVKALLRLRYREPISRPSPPLHNGAGLVKARCRVGHQILELDEVNPPRIRQGELTLIGDVPAPLSRALVGVALPHCPLAVGPLGPEHRVNDRPSVAIYDECPRRFNMPIDPIEERRRPPNLEEKTFGYWPGLTGAIGLSNLVQKVLY